MQTIIAINKVDTLFVLSNRQIVACEDTINDSYLVKVWFISYIKADASADVQARDWKRWRWYDVNENEWSINYYVLIISNRVNVNFFRKNMIWFLEYNMLI